MCKLQVALWRLGREYFAGMRRGRLGPPRLARAATILVPWGWRERRSPVGDVYTAAKQLVTGQRTQLPASS